MFKTDDVSLGLFEDVKTIEAYTKFELLHSELKVEGSKKVLIKKKYEAFTSNNYLEFYVPDLSLRMTSFNGFPFYEGQTVEDFKILRVIE